MGHAGSPARGTPDCMVSHSKDEKVETVGSRVFGGEDLLVWELDARAIADNATIRRVLSQI